MNNEDERDFAEEEFNRKLLCEEKRAPLTTTLRFTISGEYTIVREEMEKTYLTTDPDEAARIDKSSLEDDPVGFLHDATDFEVSVIRFSED